MTNHIEIIGLGGAGKTTLMSEFAKNNFNNNIRFIFPNPLSLKSLYVYSITLLIKLLIIDPKIFYRLIMYSDERWLFKKIVYRIVSVLKAPKNKLNIMVDSGYYEPLISHAMFYSNINNHNSFISYLKILNKPKAVICFNVSVDKGLERFIERESSLGKINNYDLHNLRSNFKRAEIKYEKIKEILNSENVYLTIIDGNEEMYKKETLDYLINEIEKLSIQK